MRYNVHDHLLQITKKVLLGLLVCLAKAFQSQPELVSGRVTYFIPQKEFLTNPNLTQNL